jgi:inorganic pyrophosphatase
MRINVTVEAERGSDRKAMLKDGLIVGYRETLAPYPYPYGFIPGTRGEDGDEIDCFVLTDRNLSIGVTVRCETVAAFEFMENDEKEYKVLAVLAGAVSPDIQAVHAMLTDFLRTIFRKYPDVRVTFGKLLSREETDRIIADQSA